MVSPGDQIAAARSVAIASAMSALTDPDALASAQKHLENLTTLEALSGVARKRNITHGAVILAVVLAGVGIAIGVRLTTVSVVAAVSAREIGITTGSVLVRKHGVYRNARAIVSGNSGIDTNGKKTLKEKQTSLSISQMRQTSDVLRTVWRLESSCHVLLVKEGSLEVTLSSRPRQTSAKPVPLILRGSRERAASLTICGEMVEPVTIAASLHDMTVEQRVSYGVQKTDMLPSLIAGEMDIGGRRIQLSPLDTLFIRIKFDNENASAPAALVDLSTTAVAVRLSANVSECKVGAVHNQIDQMPSILESLSKDSPLGAIYSAALAAFALIWGTRKVMVD